MNRDTDHPAARLLLATRNQGKVRELRALLADLQLELVCLTDLPDVDEVEETGTTFAENALLKARAAVLATGLVAAADDSGLCVDALGGEPGVYSARFAGPGATDRDNNALLLDRLRDVPDHERTARFVCAAALATPDGYEEVVEGSVEGLILHAPRGVSGFGYDPLFFYEPFGTSFGEAPAGRKNEVSHRARAFGRLAAVIRARLEPTRE